jgi:hypothetical protein
MESHNVAPVLTSVTSKQDQSLLDRFFFLLAQAEASFVVLTHQQNIYGSIMDQILPRCFRPCSGRLLSYLQEGDNVELPFHFVELELAVNLDDIIHMLQQATEPLHLTDFLYTSHAILWLSDTCFLVEVQAHAELSRFDTSERSGLTPYLRFELSDTPTTPRQRLFLWMSDTELVLNTDGDDDDNQQQRLAALQPAVEWMLAIVKQCRVYYVKLGLGFTDEVPTPLPVSKASLQMFLSANDALHQFVLFRFHIRPDCCRVLGLAMMEELELVEVLLEDAEEFSHGFKKNQGPKRLNIIDGRACDWLDTILEALETNTRLTHLSIRANGHALLNASMMERVGPALKANVTLVSLMLLDCPMDEKTWNLLWLYVRQNRGLKTLHLSNESLDRAMSRTALVVETLKHNKILECISIDHHDDELWRKEVLPCLARNTYSPLWMAIETTKDERYRRILFAKAITRLRYCPRLLYLGLHTCLDLVLISTAPAKAPPMLFLDLDRHAIRRQKRDASHAVEVELQLDDNSQRTRLLDQSTNNMTVAARTQPQTSVHYCLRVASLTAIKLAQGAYFLMASRDERRVLWSST